MKKVLLPILMLIVLSYACSKKDPFEPVDPPVVVGSTDEDYLKDSVVYYTKLLSLWQDYIVPRNVNDILDSTKLREVSKPYQTAEDVLNYLTSLTPIDPTTNKPIDRYSFLDRDGAVSNEIQNAMATDYGMSLLYLQTEEAFKDNDNAYLYVKMVDVNSPAYVAGIRRGDRIMSINGKTNYDWNTQNGQNFQGLYQALSSSSMSVKWRNTSSVDNEKTIVSSSYNFNPILSNKVFTVGDKKVGYLAFSSFVNVNNGGSYTQAYYNFENIFNTFEAEGINSLIVDLRYNGGGAVLTAEYMADRLVPSAANKKLMYSYKVNTVLGEDWGWKEEGESFAPVYFSKRGGLEIPTVYFLVTSATASASELLINSLAPYMNVQIIGPEKTYGKPVGFFGLDMGRGRATGEIYVTSFQMFNADNYGDYFAGLSPQKVAREDFLKDFGDVEEGLIAEALYHTKYGNYSTAQNRAVAAKDRLRIDNTKNIKNVSKRVSDLGMFKFKGEKPRLK